MILVYNDIPQRGLVLWIYLPPITSTTAFGTRYPLSVLLYPNHCVLSSLYADISRLCTPNPDGTSQIFCSGKYPPMMIIWWLRTTLHDSELCGAVRTLSLSGYHLIHRKDGMLRM